MHKDKEYDKKMKAQRETERAREVATTIKKPSAAVKIFNVIPGNKNGINGGWAVYQANAAGGWSVCCDIENTGDKMIKYVHITFAAYNSVFDKCYSSVCGVGDAICTFTGPLMPGEVKKGIVFENLWYDIPLSKVKIEEVVVEFMDSSVINYGPMPC